MKTLYLLRHTKSDWGDPRLADRDRPLAPRGKKAARRIAEHVEAAGIRPALALCSPACRARDTLTLIRDALGEQMELRVEEALYGADAADVIARLREVPASIPSVLVVGHNPTLEELTAELTGEGDRAATEQLATKFPTGALATLTFRTDGWEDVGPGSGYLEALVVPRR